MLLLYLVGYIHDHLTGKGLFIQFAVRVFCKLLSGYDHVDIALSLFVLRAGYEQKEITSSAG